MFQTVVVSLMIRMEVENRNTLILIPLDVIWNEQREIHQGATGNKSAIQSNLMFRVERVLSTGIPNESSLCGECEKEG